MMKSPIRQQYQIA